jgi:copper homeostasis protein
VVRAVVAAVRIPVRVMVRETDTYDVASQDERDRLRAAARACQTAGVDGLVIGFLRRGSSVDLATTMDVLAAAPGVRATFHHAFDECVDALAALAQLRACRQIDVVLTHGIGRHMDRAAHLAWLDRAAAGIRVMVGGGVDVDVIRTLRDCESIGAFHIGRAAREPGRADGRVTEARVRALAEALRHPWSATSVRDESRAPADGHAGGALCR